MESLMGLIPRVFWNVCNINEEAGFTSSIDASFLLDWNMGESRPNPYYAPRIQAPCTPHICHVVSSKRAGSEGGTLQVGGAVASHQPKVKSADGWDTVNSI
jgi:hypothetical protein